MSKLRFLLFGAWAVVMLALALMPDPPRINDWLFGWDKLNHAAAFALLTLLGGLAFGSLTIRRLTAWSLALAFSVFFGLLVEVMQAWLTTSRRMESADLVADLLGAALVFLPAAVRARSIDRQQRKKGEG